MLVLLDLSVAFYTTDMMFFLNDLNVYPRHSIILRIGLYHAYE